MLASVEASVVGVLKKPSIKASTVGIELLGGSKHVQEHALNSFLGFTVVPHNSASYSEDQGAVPFKQDSESIVAAHA